MRCAGAASAATLTSPSSTPTMQQPPRVVTSMHVIPLRRMGKPLLTCGAAPMFHTGTAPLAAQALDGAMHREFVHASITSAPVRTVENRRADAGGHHISSAVVRTSGLRTRPQACEALERPREYAAVQSMDANDLRHASGDGTTTASGTKVQRRIGCAGERTHIVLSHPVRSSPSCARRTRLTRGGEYDPG